MLLWYMNRYIKSTRELNLSVLKQTFKGETMYTITNDQLKLIKKALTLLEDKLDFPHTIVELETLVEAFNAYDDIIDNQEVSND